MRCLRLRRILQSSASPTPQGMDPIEDAGGPPTPRACEPLAVAAKHRGCVEVRHKQASELTLIIALDEPDTICVRNNTQLVGPTVVVLPRYGPDATIHNWPEQSHALEIGQIDAAPM